MSVNNIKIFGVHIEGVKGKVTLEKPMKSITWLRVGGAAAVFFQPSNASDLCKFLRLLPESVNILPIGVCSNLLVRDGGIPGVTIRLGRGFSDIDIDGSYITAGAAVLDSRIAEVSAQNSIDLSFLKTIPTPILRTVIIGTNGIVGTEKKRWSQSRQIINAVMAGLSLFAIIFQGRRGIGPQY